MREKLNMSESAAVGAGYNPAMTEGMILGHAHLLMRHHRATDWIKDPKTGLLVPDPRSYELIDESESWNLITNAGRVAAHKQLYGTTGLLSNGFNYIGLSNDALTEDATSTVLSNEIAANGLTRAQGTVTLASGSGNTTTVSKVFTATGSQSAQKAALFTASSGGTMNHVLSFTQRNLINTDTLTPTFTLTLG